MSDVAAFTSMGETPPTASSSAQINYPLKFTGNWKDYFGIWIVNIMLSILTLGIYSAWAKVRDKKYFLGNTVLDGHRFDYHANPKQLLIGRIVAVALLGIYTLVANISPQLILFIIVPFALLLPWLLNKSFRFNAKMTSYRNVRFHFAGSYWGTLKAFLLWPFIIALPPIICSIPVMLILYNNGTDKITPELTASNPYLSYFPALLLLAFLVSFFLWPLTTKARQKYYINNHFYGHGQANSTPPNNGYYGAFFFSILTSLLITLLASALFIPLIYSMFTAGINPENFTKKGEFDFMNSFLWMYWALAMLTGLFYVIIRQVYNAMCQNHTIRHSILDKTHHFRSDLSGFQTFWILIGNLFISLATLMLMRPWAKCRLYKYKTEVLAMLSNGSLDGYVSKEINNKGVGAEEFMDIGDFDFGF